MRVWSDSARQRGREVLRRVDLSSTPHITALMGGVASAGDGTYACREWEQGP